MIDWKWNDEQSGWIANASDEETTLVIAGLHESPEPQLCSAALSLIGKADVLKEIIADALHKTSIEVHEDDCMSVVLHPERPSVNIVQLEILDSTQPTLAHVFVNTGYPDPFYLYDVTLDDMSVINIIGRFW